MGTLSAAISHLLGGDSAVRPQRRQRSGVFPRPATGARSGCSSGPESVFGLRRNRCSACAGMGVRLAPESVFAMARCTHQDRAETSRRSRRSEPALVFALAITSCTTGPLPTLPQVEQATEAVQGGAERYRA